MILYRVGIFGISASFLFKMSKNIIAFELASGYMNSPDLIPNHFFPKVIHLAMLRLKEELERETVGE